MPTFVLEGEAGSSEQHFVPLGRGAGPLPHYKTPSLGPSLGPKPDLGGVPWWPLVGFSLGPRLHQGSARLGGALVDGNPPRLGVLVVRFEKKNVTFQNYFEPRGVLTSGHIFWVINSGRGEI